jgi:hypothetical protein
VPGGFPRGPGDRTARFLQRIGADPVRADAARGIHIELVADRLDPATETTLALTTMLLLRMAEYAPTIHLITPNDRTAALPLLPDAPLPEALATAYAGFPSADRLTTAPARNCDLRLVYSGARTGVPVSTNGWAVAVGEILPGGGNALAAAYAATLAAGEVLKLLLPPLGAPATRSRIWRGAVNLWDYSLTANPGPKIDSINLGPQAWVGAGGVASAAAWALAALPATGTLLSGTGIVVDHDVIDDDGTNLNRHLTALIEHLGMPKAQLLADLLRPAGIQLDVRQKQWGELPQADRHPPLAVVSVDDDAVRRAVQRDMPALVLNAGTGDSGQYQSTRHNFLDDACLACISHADQTATGPEHSLAQRLGLTIGELQPHLHSARPLPTGLLARLTVSGREREQIASTPARDLLEHFCATLHTDEGPAVSIPMLSAAAGALLAVELVKTALAGHNSVSGQVVRTNVLTGPHPRWWSRRAKATACTCQDPIYREYFRKRWPR